MNLRRFTLPAAVLCAASILLAGCAGPEDTAQPAHTSTTLIAPVTADSPSSPTAAPANQDPHAFTQ